MYEKEEKLVCVVVAVEVGRGDTLCANKGVM